MTNHNINIHEKEMADMMKMECKDCGGELNILEDVVVGEIVSCPDCGAEFEVTSNSAGNASYSGINVANFKVINFSLASFFTGIAGSAMAHYINYISPYVATLDESIYQLQMAILGGLGSLPGSILGASILVVVPEISRTFYEYRLMFVGIIMVIMMIWAPNGILGRNGIGEKVIGIKNLILGKNIKKLTEEENHKP